MSVRQLIQNGYFVIFGDGNARIFANYNGLVTEVKMSVNKAFPLPSCNQFALKNEVLDTSSLWHLRYDHLQNQGLHILKQKKMVIGLP